MSDTIHLGASWGGAGLDDDALRRARAASSPLAERLGLEAQLAPLDRHRWSADACPAGRPTLFLDDVSAIPFLINISGVEEYQHRARVRSGEGDLFVAVTPSAEGYIDYCRDHLQLGNPEFLLAEQVGRPMEVARACAHGSTFARLVERARAAQGMAIHPYMGIEAVWELAEQLAAEAGVEVRVLAPPAPVTWIANDKALFSEVVTRTLGEGWVVETTTTRDPRVMAETLLGMSTRHRRAGLKRTRCASGMGNVHYDLVELAGRGLEAIEREVQEFLKRTEWCGTEDVLVVAWEETDLSPSTQMWIPPVEEGPPVLEGIYVQILEGAERVFVGSRPSNLPAPVNQEIARASLEVSAAFQALGYVGRCSYDLLVLGDPEGEFQIMFTECNGRWGGTSTPMHLVERLVEGPRPPYRAQDFVHPDLVGWTLNDVLERVGEAAYDPRSGRGKFIFYNLGPLKTSGKLDVISLGETQDEAEAGLLELLPRLLGIA